MQVAIASKHKNIAGKLLKMLKEPEQIRSQFSPQYELDQLKILKRVAENHIHFSEIYLSVLWSMSLPYGSEKNPHPWRTLKEGSYYLGNAYKLVEVCKDCKLGSIDDNNIQSVNDMLVALEFDPKHISSGYTDEAYGGEVECFVSEGQGTEYYKLLHSELNKDVRSFMEMVKRYIDIPAKEFLESIKKRLPFSEKLLDAIENDNRLAVENCIERDIDVNYKYTDGRTPLHHAVNKGKKDIVSTLIMHGADVTHIANNGDTPLHIASSKGYKEVVEVLLQCVSRDKLNDCINAGTAIDGSTSLHVAAKNGFLEVVKSLLRHGATYNIENKEGKMPIDLSKDQKVINFLKLIEELFRDIKNGNREVINKLRALKPDESLAITNALNNEGNTLLQIAIANKHKTIGGKLLEMVKYPEQIRSQFSPEYKLDQLKMLKTVAENHIYFSELYLPVLRSMSESYGSDKNPHPWRTLKEGSYYLRNAYRLVEACKDCMFGSIDDENIQSVNDMLVAFEFDPKHISSGYTDEAYGGVAKCFVSEGQGTEYYKLLHSELNKDVRSFIEMVELNIDIPVKNFLESIKKRLPFSEKLLDAIENGNHLAVENCIKRVVDVNYKDTDGKTPLHHAVNKGKKDIVSTLLMHGADVAHIANNGDTPLHIASSKGYTEVVEVLLQCVSRDKLSDYINAGTAFDGTTSLHVAAKNGSLEVVKTLLKYGATYNIENKEGKIPIDLSKDQKVINFLRIIEELFREIKNGNAEAISTLRALKPDEFLAITNARNNKGHTLLQVSIANKHNNIAGKLLKMLKNPEQIRSQFSTEYELQLKNLKRVAEKHIYFSEIYLPVLRSMSQSYGSDKNPHPWRTLKEGSYYLGNAYDLVEVCKDCMHGSIDDKNIQSVNDMLVALEFDPKHISSGYTDEAYGGEVECFVSEGQGTEYYKLLHSELKKDVRSFIEIVELNIDIPVKRFLESIKKRLPFSEKLLDAVENDNPLAEGCLIF